MQANIEPIYPAPPATRILSLLILLAFLDEMKKISVFYRTFGSELWSLSNLDVFSGIALNQSMILLLNSRVLFLCNIKEERWKCGFELICLYKL
jgi:hypothetical protein